jgi:trigger factor
MKSIITSTTDTTKTLTVTLDEQDLKDVVKHTYDHLRAKVKAAGFRPGKAPDHIVDRELGAQVVQAEVIDSALGATYPKALVENEINPVGSPQVEVSKFVPYTELEYILTVEVLAPIKLADYKKLKTKAPEVKVEAKEVDAAVEDLRKRLASHEPVTRPAQLQDETVIDFEGSQKGVLVPGAKGADHHLVLGSGSFIPGFEEELIGVKAGESKTFDITFPKEYHEKSLAGAVVTFKVDVKEVHQIILPEVTDSLAVEVAGVKTVKELRADIEARLKAEKESEAMRDYENQLIEEIVKGSKYKVPEGLVGRQLEAMRAEFGQQLMQSGLDLDKWLNLTGKNAEEFDKELRPKAEDRVAAGIVMSEIAKLENISVSDEDIEEELGRLKVSYPDPAMQAELQKPELREEIFNHLMASRTLAKLVEYNKK